MSYRYGSWSGGPDPLAAPFDARTALDELGDAVLRGADPARALAELMHRGFAGRRGLDDLLRRVRDRQASLRRQGRLDGTLRRVKEMLAEALAEERRALFPDPDDLARCREAELDSLPSDPARAIRQLSEYEWASPAARTKFEEIRDLLRAEVLDSQFRGMKQALTNPDPAALARVRDMLRDLTALLDADSRGADVRESFDEFMASYGDFFPDNPATLEELVDSLARRAAAGARLMASLSAEQRDELSALMSQAMSEAGLGEGLGRLASALRERRPDLDWSSRQRMRGGGELGLGDATTALAELADLDDLAATLAQDYPGAELDDVDEGAVERALGRQAVEDLAQLRRIERELSRQGYLRRQGGELELTPRAVRRLGETALRRVFTAMAAPRRGEHDVADAGAAGELIGSSRPWAFGDEAPIDVVATLRNTLLRTGELGPGALQVDDFEVVETERRTGAAVALLVDLSYSMALRDTWGAAKATALALHTLVATRYPQDAVAIIGFSDYARVLTPTQLAGLSWDAVKGTNLQHALMLAGRHLSRHPQAEPLVLVVTDGEPTAHLERDGSAYFDWPPDPKTVALTLAEVDAMTRRGATINIFMLDDEPRLLRFVDTVARRNGGRVFSPDPSRLGEFVVSDYLQARRGRRGS